VAEPGDLFEPRVHRAHVLVRIEQQYSFLQPLQDALQFGFGAVRHASGFVSFQRFQQDGHTPARCGPGDPQAYANSVVQLGLRRIFSRTWRSRPALQGSAHPFLDAFPGPQPKNASERISCAHAGRRFFFSPGSESGQLPRAAARRSNSFGNIQKNHGFTAGVQQRSLPCGFPRLFLIPFSPAQFGGRQRCAKFQSFQGPEGDGAARQPGNQRAQELPFFLQGIG